MSKNNVDEIIKAVERYKNGETSQGAEAKRLGVSQQTFQDWIRKHETFGIDGFEHTGHKNVSSELDSSSASIGKLIGIRISYKSPIGLPVL